MLELRLTIPVFAITMLLTVPLRATTSYYSGAAAETNFTIAVGGLTLLDPTLTFAPGDLGSNGLFNASGTGIDFLGFDDQNAPAAFTVNSGRLTATQPGERVVINFPAAGVYAFGMHITLTSGFATWCIGLTQGSCTYSVVNLSNSAANVQFFGLVSNTPITTSLYIQNSGGSPSLVLTDFEAFSVPEPRTLLLVGIGLIILSAARRKIQQGI